MWGMYLGTNLAWRHGITHLHVESDSKVLIDMVTDRVKLNESTPTLVLRIRHLLRIRSAYWLANFSYSLDSFDIHVLEFPPRELQSMLFDHISRACMPRNVLVIL
ncbi:uncharacterized protein LOC123886688 [Trifolium pratense]|uniref:uncharacterized protein LOC123886688 n=1 Tax=Trifolium pratense TaxID=57577 RepID=UPI001E690001|nr:uncharacterized protein LOC123886688 [Trifolium pratense]